jgi:hypothetical protein
MSKSVLSLFLSFTLILVALPPPASAQQGASSQQQKDKKEEKGKGGTGRKILGILKNPDKAVDDLVDKVTGEKRGWTDKQKQDANTAQALFRFSPPSTSAVETGASQPVYDPTDTAAAQEMAARVEAVKAKYSNKRSLSPSEEQEIATAVTPFLRYAEAAGVSDVSERDLQPYKIQADATGRIQIPPRSQVVLKLKTVCMDFTAPAPQAGEKMHIVPTGDLMRNEFQQIYNAVVAYSHNHQDVETQAQVQRITWNLRHGCFKDKDELRALRLRAEDETLLDSLVSGASRTVKERCKKLDFPKLGKDLLRATLNGGGRLDINPAGLIDANQSVLRVVQAQTQLKVNEPIPDDNSDYSLLQEGVAVRSQHTKSSASETELLINNATDQPATFAPDEWSLESRRTVQRLGIVGLEPGLVYLIIGVAVIAAVLAAMFFARFLGARLLAGLVGPFIRGGRGLRPGGVAGGTRPPPTRPPTGRPPSNSPYPSAQLPGRGSVSVRRDLPPQPGGRSGNNVPNITGPANSAIRGNNGRVYVTDVNGRVVLDITRERTWLVQVQGSRARTTRAPTPEEINLIRLLWH